MAVPKGWKLRIKADIDANLPTSYVVKVKLTCEQMVGWNNAINSLSFVHPDTNTSFSPPITVSDWDAEDYSSLVWDSTPLPTEVN